MNPRLTVRTAWRRQMSVEAAGRRCVQMLLALAAVDHRFTNLLTGGRSSNPAKGWRPVPLAEAALTDLLRKSDKDALRPDYGGTPTWAFGAWNGSRDEATSASLVVVIEGVGPPGALSFGGSARVDAGLQALSPQQVQAIVEALIEAWEPDDAERIVSDDGATVTSRYLRGRGWLGD